MSATRLKTIYTEQYRVECHHGDCPDMVIVTISREQGGVGITDVSARHEHDRLTDTNKQESVNDASRLRK